MEKLAIAAIALSVAIVVFGNLTEAAFAFMEMGAKITAALAGGGGL